MQLRGGVVYLSILGGGFGGDGTQGGRMEPRSKSYSQVQTGNGDSCIGCGGWGLGVREL